MVANLIGLARFGEEVEGRSAVDPVCVYRHSGSIACRHGSRCHPHETCSEPYVFSYLLHELQIELVSSDVSNYFRGRQFGFDVSVFLNPSPV